MTWQKVYNMDVVDALKLIEDNSIDCVMTSPPYWGLRDYGVEGQIGLEEHPQEYIDKIVKLFAIIKQKLKKTGSVYLNLGDTYYGSGAGTEKNPDINDGRKEIYVIPYQSKKSVQRSKKDNWLQPKQLLGIPWRIAIALQTDGWILRNAIIWNKPNPMPSSVKDRLNNTYEFIFHFVKSRKYYYDLDAIREEHSKKSLEDLNRRKSMRFITNPKVKSAQTGLMKGDGGNRLNRTREEFFHDSGKNPGDVFDVATQPFPEAHFAVFPEEICMKPIKSSCPKEICDKCGFIRERIIETNNPSKLYDEKMKKEAEERGYTKHSASRIITGLYTKGKDWYVPKNFKGFTFCQCNAGFHAGTVLDPFVGSGTTLKVARYLGRNSIGIEINKKYIEIIKRRMGWNHDTLVKNWEVIEDVI